MIANANNLFDMNFTTLSSSASAALDSSSGNLSTTEPHTEIHFQLVTFDWDSVQTPYTVSAWLLLASVSKILLHVNKKFGETVPDSALLIVLGLLVGALLWLFDVDHRIYTLQSHIFFYYLLPPIIFDAGFFMPNRQLFENLDSVLLFAFVGTIWNTLAIGFSLLSLSELGCFSVPFSMFQVLLFASLISAVDPVAVIAVFEEIHVNEFLFINVFGEALFNDGVSVVLYKMFREFALIGQTNLNAFDYIQGIISFLFISFGGILIGLLFAIIASIATRYTNHMRILAPVFIFLIPYMSYMTAELFGVSSILAIIACGIAMKQYVKGNLTHDAYSSVKYFVKMLAQCSETVIFMFLGLSIISPHLVWDWAFIGATLAFCLIYRVIGVVVQCAVLNHFRRKHFSATDQFVLSYGGLRGAIAFGLVISTHPSLHFPARQMFITTCLCVILFTVFVQGISIRPLLFWLKVKKSKKLEEDEANDQHMVESIFTRYMDYTMAGLEQIAGQRGNHHLRDCFERFNAKLLKPVLVRDEERKSFDASPIIRAYTKITLQEALKIAQNTTEISKKSNKVRVIRSQTSLPATIMRNQSRGAGDQLRRRYDHQLDIDKLLENRENVELLYSLFSRLLDRKIEEHRVHRVESGMEDDIKDDYIGIVIGTQPQQQQQASTTTGTTALPAATLAQNEGNSSSNIGGEGDGRLLWSSNGDAGKRGPITRDFTSPGQLCAIGNGISLSAIINNNNNKLATPTSRRARVQSESLSPTDRNMIFHISSAENGKMPKWSDENGGDNTCAPMDEDSPV